MKQISLITMLAVTATSYAAENQYEHIVNAINGSTDLEAERAKIFSGIQDVIYKKSSSEITAHQLRNLTVPQLVLLLKEIKSRSAAVQIIEKSKKSSELQRLDELRCIIASEYKKWREEFIYKEDKRDFDWVYIYHPEYY